MNRTAFSHDFSHLGSSQTDAKAGLAKYLRNWYWFALGLLLALGGAFLYLRYTTPLYSISSLVFINDRRDMPQQQRNEQFDYANDQTTAKNLDNEVIMFKSVSLMQRVLKELGFTASYYVEGKVRTQEVYEGGVPFRLLINQIKPAAYQQHISITLTGGNNFKLEETGQPAASYQFGQLINRPYGSFTVVNVPLTTNAIPKKTFEIKFVDLPALAASYTKELNVSPINKQASILSLSMLDEVPDKAKDIINKLVEVHNQESLENKNSVAASTLGFIDARLKNLGAELTNVEKGVENYKRKNEVANVSSQINQSLEDASSYNRQISDYSIQLTVLESVAQYIGNANSHQLIPSTLSVQEPTLSGLITKYNELQLDRERMLRTAQDSNPVVVGMTEQLTNLRSSILANIGTVRNGLLASRRSLQTKSSQSDSRIQRVPTIERGLEEINREQDLKRSLYQFLLQKREEAALSLAATYSTARTIDPASYSEHPVSPQKSAVLALALMLGLGVPYGLITLLSLFNTKVQQLQDVTSVTNVPILGELIHNDSNESIVITKAKRTGLAEMFRLVRTNLQFSLGNQLNKVVLVTSSMSGEGKSFFSLNLAASLVLADKNVVLLNLDLRKREALQDEQSGQLGVAEYLQSNSITVKDIMHASTQVPGLQRIGTGKIPANPAELLMSNKLAELLEVLKHSFDYVILDSSPIGQVADAFALSPNVDYTIYLVRYNVTNKPQLEIINKIQADKTFESMGLVINDAKKKNLNDYGYGNGYGYGSPYEEEKKGKRFV